MKLPVKGLAYKVVGATAKISSVSSDPKKNSLIENMLSSSFAHHIDRLPRPGGLIPTWFSAKNVQGVSARAEAIGWWWSSHIHYYAVSYPRPPAPCARMSPDVSTPSREPSRADLTMIWPLNSIECALDWPGLVWKMAKGTDKRLLKYII